MPILTLGNSFLTLLNEHYLNLKYKNNTENSLFIPTLSNDFSNIVNFGIFISKKYCSDVIIIKLVFKLYNNNFLIKFDILNFLLNLIY